MTDAALIGPVDAPDLHVMTFNVRRRMPRLVRRRRDAWSRRRKVLRTLLSAERPALLGVQEALADQVDFVAETLGPAYRWIGYGRNANRTGERCPIFYDSARLEVTDWRQSALSATPQRPGSRSWGNMIPRVVVSASLTDLATGARFTAINTHLDHLSARSRRESARMLERIASFSSAPVVLMGDANAPVGGVPYRMLTRDGGLVDAWVSAEQRLTAEWGTFSGYRPPRLGGKRIDWILVSPSIRVVSAAINSARYDGAAPSDHEPVQAVLRLPDPSVSEHVI